jgi:hypothetical protein
VIDNGNSYFFFVEIPSMIAKKCNVFRETEHFRIFVKTFAKIFAKVFVIFVYFRMNIFAKTKINFRENTKAKIFVSTLDLMLNGLAVKQ